MNDGWSRFGIMVGVLCSWIAVRVGQGRPGIVSVICWSSYSVLYDQSVLLIILLPRPKTVRFAGDSVA